MSGRQMMAARTYLEMRDARQLRPAAAPREAAAIERAVSMTPAEGRGLGGHLLSFATERAWELAPPRVWLHTSTLDHPAALPNYLSRGFVVTGAKPTSSPCSAPLSPNSL